MDKEKEVEIEHKDKMTDMPEDLLNYKIDKLKKDMNIAIEEFQKKLDEITL